MCTITKKCPKLQIAEEDIIVYKQVLFIRKNNQEKYIVSFAYGFIYDLNKVYETILDSFSLEACGKYYESKRGFYSYKNKEESCNVKCIIPKGSKYYLCEDNHKMIYHSDKIKLIEII